MEDNLLLPAGSTVEAVSEERGETGRGLATQRGLWESEVETSSGPHHPGTETVLPSEGDMIVGSDSRMYRLLGGPPGPIGPPGKRV